MDFSKPVKKTKNNPPHNITKNIKRLYTVGLCVAKRLFLLFNFCLHDLLTVEEMQQAPWSREETEAAGREKQKAGSSELQATVSIIKERGEEIKEITQCKLCSGYPVNQEAREKHWRKSGTHRYLLQG